MPNQPLHYSDGSLVDTIMVLPLGAWEQHGAHLPLNTDSIIIDVQCAGSLARCGADATSKLWKVVG